MSLRPLRVLTVLATVAGLLGVAAPARAEDHRPAANCAPPVPATNSLLAVFTGEAHAAVGHSPLVTLTLHCVYEGPNAWFNGHVTEARPVVTLATASGLFFSEFDTVCSSAEAVYADGHVASTPQTCRPILTPAADTGPLPSQGTPSQLTCQHTRGPLVTYSWIVAVVGVASTGTDVPQSTRVSCTLTTTEDVVPATGAAIGPVAVGSWAQRSAYAPIVSKCYTMNVEYVGGRIEDTGTCESF